MQRWPASATSGGASARSRTSSRSPGRCSSWPRRSSSAPRTRRSPRGRTARRSTRSSPTWPPSSTARSIPLLARREGGKRLIVLITTDRGLAGPLNTNIVRFAPAEIIDKPGRRGGRHRRPQGPRRAAPRPACRSRPTSRVRRPAELRRRDAAGPAHHRRLPGRARTARSTSSTPSSSRRSSSGPSSSSSCRSCRAADTEGIPGNQFIFEPNRRRPSSSSSCRATWRPASSRPSWRRRPARSRAGWWP